MGGGGGGCLRLNKSKFVFQHFFKISFSNFFFIFFFTDNAGLVIYKKTS